VAQYFLLYSMAGDLADLDAAMDFEGRLGNVRVTMDRGRWSDFEAVIEPAEAYLRRHIHGTDLAATISGSGNARHQRAVELRRGYPLGVVLAFVAVLAMAALTFRSLVAGLLCLVPVVLAVLGTYAVMGAAGIWLGLGTSMAAAIAIGLAVDFAVHTLSRLQTLVRDDGHGLETALLRLYPTTGRALAFNFLAVFLGFGVLAASRVPAIGQFGMLVAVCVAAGFLASLTVLVAVVRLAPPGFLGARPASSGAITAPACGGGV
jgi:predicted RND superfamily exporter protein